MHVTHRYLGNPANAGTENIQRDLTSPPILDRAVQQNQAILLTKSGHGAVFIQHRFSLVFLAMRGQIFLSLRSVHLRGHLKQL